MKISAQEEYGLRCLLQLARAESEGETLTLSQIARREGKASWPIALIPRAAKLSANVARNSDCHAA